MNQKSSESQRVVLTSQELETALGVIDKLHRCETKLECGKQRLNTFYMQCANRFGNKKARKIAQRHLKKQHIKEIKSKAKEKQKLALLHQVKNSERKMIKEQIKMAQQAPMLAEDQQTKNYSYYRCYICKAKITSPHYFYHQHCKKCGDYDFMKRSMRCNLKGKTALLTGGRTKIGFEIALALLRNGAEVVVTTRFPKSAAIKFSKVEDYNDWKSNLIIFGVDLKLRTGILHLCQYMKRKFKKLDIVINNAAQTIRKPPSAYTPLIQTERALLPSPLVPMLANVQSAQNQQQEAIVQNFGGIDSSYLSTVPFIASDLSSAGFDHDFRDVHEELVDMRQVNSWIQKLDDTPVTQFVEVLMVNVIAPFLLNQQLKPLLAACQKHAFIVNVSAMEGVFNMKYKSSRHPHTNMAKAALNMMTRTCGIDYAASEIFMTSVDTGWVTNEYPQSFESSFAPPLDEMDGAMRVLDPIFTAINEDSQPMHSVFLKNYKVHPW